MPKSFGSTESTLSLRSDLLGEDGVQGFGQALARAAPVGRGVLHAVGDPEVGQAGLAQGLADGRADLAAADAVLDPELADALVRVGQGKPARRPWDGRNRSG